MCRFQFDSQNWYRRGHKIYAKWNFAHSFSDTGNEDILTGVKITSDYLYDGTEVIQLKNLPFTQDRKTLSDPEFVPSYIECKEQCTARYVWIDM